MELQHQYNKCQQQAQNWSQVEGDVMSQWMGFALSLKLRYFCLCILADRIQYQCNQRSWHIWQGSPESTAEKTIEEGKANICTMQKSRNSCHNQPQVGGKSLSKDEEKEFSQLKSKMGKIYGTGQVCLGNGTCMDLEPELTDLMAYSHNATLRDFIWQVSFITLNLLHCFLIPSAVLSTK